MAAHRGHHHYCVCRRRCRRCASALPLSSAGCVCVCVCSAVPLAMSAIAPVPVVCICAHVACCMPWRFRVRAGLAARRARPDGMHGQTRRHVRDAPRPHAARRLHAAVRLHAAARHAVCYADSRTRALWHVASRACVCVHARMIPFSCVLIWSVRPCSHRKPSPQKVKIGPPSL